MSLTQWVERAVLAVYGLAFFVFLFAPIAAVVLFSFDSKGIPVLPFKGPTLRWYVELTQDPIMLRGARNSALVAIGTALATVLVGTSAAFALTRYRTRFAIVLGALVALPMVLPHLLLGVALLSFFTSLGLQLSVGTAIVGHVLVTLPFVVFTTAARLASVDPALAETARTLGATAWQSFRYITFPTIRPAVVASALLVVGWSIDEFIVSFFTIGSQNTLPIVIWGQMRAGVSPTVNAVSTLLLLITIILVAVVYRLTDVRFR